MLGGDDLGEFWARVDADGFSLQRCGTCGDVRWPPKTACPTCLGETYSWVPSSGAGSVWTFTVMHRTGREFQQDTPFVIATVELDERPRRCLVTARLEGCAPEDVRIGMRVVLKVRPGEQRDLSRLHLEPEPAS